MFHVAVRLARSTARLLGAPPSEKDPDTAARAAGRAAAGTAPWTPAEEAASGLLNAKALDVQPGWGVSGPTFESSATCP